MRPRYTSVLFWSLAVVAVVVAASACDADECPSRNGPDPRGQKCDAPADVYCHDFPYPDLPPECGTFDVACTGGVWRMEGHSEGRPGCAGSPTDAGKQGRPDARSDASPIDAGLGETGATLDAEAEATSDAESDSSD